MSKRPLVSVLVPTYNYARFLPQAIESVLGQDHSDFELLISDDASQDESASIIQDYAEQDSRIRFQVHSTNLGMVPNWNWCLQNARGKYIKFLFGDDRFTAPHALRKLTEMLENNPSAVLATSARRIINEYSEPITIWDHIRAEGLHHGLEMARKCLFASQNLIGEPSAVLFQASFARRPFNSRYQQIVDLEMWCYLLRSGDLVYTREALCDFRCHQAQQSEANRKLSLGNREQIYLLQDSMNIFLPDELHLSEDNRRDLFSTLFHVRKAKRPSPDARVIEETLMPILGKKWYAAYWLKHRLYRPFDNLHRAWHKHVLKTPRLRVESQPR